LNAFDNSGESRAVVTIVHSTQDALSRQEVRRLTPVECERLQGFSEIEKYAIIELCIDHQKNPAPAAIKSLKWHSFAGNVEEQETGSLPPVRYVGRYLATKDPSIKRPVHLSVLLNCVGKIAELHNQEKLLWSASFAEIINSSALPIKIEDFVLHLAHLMQTVEKITNGGKEELQKVGIYLEVAENGKTLEKSSGSATTLPVKDVGLDLTTPPKHTTSIILPPTDIKNIEQHLATSFCYVLNVIAGCIPQKILRENTLVLQIRDKEGWTTDQSDSARYKQMGNAVTANVVEWIGGRL
jgi:hypothetical protein